MGPLETCPECGRTVNVSVNARCPAVDCAHSFTSAPQREIRTDGGVTETGGTERFGGER